MTQGQNLQDQDDEMQALEALLSHEEEFTQLSPTSCLVKMRPYGERGVKDPSNKQVIAIRFQFTPNYPQELPVWSFDKGIGVSDYDIENLRPKIELNMRQNLGNPMIYSVAELVVEWLRERNEPAQSMYDQMMDRKSKSEYSCNEREAVTDIVNSESTTEEYQPPADKILCVESARCSKQEFESWSQSFRIEMEQRGVWKSSNNKSLITGRQMFMEDAVGAAAAADEEVAEGEADSAFWNDASLFNEGLNDFTLED